MQLKQIFKHFDLHATRFTRSFLQARRSFSVKSILRLRVSIKRILAVTSAVQTMSTLPCPKRQRSRLRRLYKSAGVIRDAQIQQQLVAKFALKYHLDLSEYHHYLMQCELKARKAFTIMVTDFKPGTLRRLRRYASEALTAVEDQAAVTILQNHISNELTALAAVPADNSNGDVAYHQIRLHIKQIRNALEIQRRYIGRENFLQQKLVEKLADLQGVLGKWRDIDIALNRLDKFVVKHGDREIYSPKSYKKFREQLQKRQEKAIRQFDASWPDLQTHIRQASKTSS